MKSSVSLSSFPINKLIIGLLLILLVMGILLNPLVTPPGRDSGIFLYIGSLILKGKMPYVAAWENKGPLIFYINALGLLISGGSRWGIWLLEFLFLLGSAAIGYLTAKKYMGKIPALAGTFFWVNAAAHVLEGGNLSEEYSLLFYFLAAWAFLKSIEEPDKKRFGFIVGVSMGFSILLRPNNIGIHLAIFGTYFLLFLFSKERRLLLERFVLAVVGSLTVLLPVIIYFAAKGSLTEMFKVVILFNMQYSDERTLSGVLNGIQNAVGAIGIGYLLPAPIGFVAVLWSLFRQDGLKTVHGKFLLMIIIGFPIEIILSTLSGRNYLHYFILWVPYIGFLSAYAVYLLWGRLSRTYEKPAEYAVVLILFLVSIFGNLNVWKNYGSTISLVFSSPKPVLEYRIPVADYVQAHTQPSDKVLIWGFRPAVYFMSGREAPASFLPYPLIHVDTPLGYQWGEQFLEQFTATPPVIIVDMVNPEADPIPSLNEEIRKTQKRVLRTAVLAPSLDNFFEYVKTHYTLSDEADGYPVYRLKTTSK